MRDVWLVGFAGGWGEGALREVLAREGVICLDSAAVGLVGDEFTVARD